MEPGNDWTVEKRPNLLLRMRASAALRAYDEAEKPYRRLVWEMESLEAERKAVLQSLVARHRAAKGSTGDLDAYLASVSAELQRINERFYELSEPWEKAEAAMKSAYAATQRVLRDLGFSELPDARKSPEDPS